METFFAFLAFLNGLALGAGGVFVVMRKPRAHETAEDAEAKRMAQQYENFLNYDGTERGQKGLGD